MSTAAYKPEPELTREQLQLALRELWRPGWPNDLDAILADPTRGVCVRGLARCRARMLATARPHRTSLPSAPVPPTPTQAPARRDRAPASTASGKRAAANDFDD